MLRRHGSGIWILWRLLRSLAWETKVMLGTGAAKLKFTVTIRIRETTSHLNKPLSRVFMCELEKVEAS